MDKIITFVGTSLFQNYPHLMDLAKTCDFKVLKRNAFEVAKDFVKDQECCAELASILPLGGSKQVHLIATKSAKSIFCGYFIKRVLNHHNIKVIFNPSRSVNLSFDRYENYERGLEELLDRIFELLQESDPQKLIFNITSGYRGIIPYIGAIAQVFNCKVLYDFRGEENHPIIIEPLPIEFDRSILHILYPYLRYFDKVKIPKTLAQHMNEMGLIKDGALTPIGKIALYAAEEQVYTRSILGHEIELLLYEFFNDNKEEAQKQIRFSYKYVKRGLREEGFKSDIDIYLANRKEFVWIEIKPISYLDNFNRLLRQFKNYQFHDIKLHNKKLNRYIVIIYGFKIPKKVYTAKVRKFREKMLQEGIESDVFYIEIPLKKPSKMLLHKNNLHKIISSFRINQLERLT